MSTQTALTPGGIFHIGFEGNNGARLFHGEDDYQRYLETFVLRCSPAFKLLAHACLGNHAHHALMVRDFVLDMEYNCITRTPVTPKFASQSISNFLNSHAKYINLRHNRRGNLFHKGFWREAIEGPERLRNLIRYIHDNATHHGFVNDPFDWPYSSLNHYNRLLPEWLCADPVFDWFDGRAGFLKAATTPLTDHECRALRLFDCEDIPLLVGN